MKKALLFLATAVVSSSLAYAQQRQITGKVRGDDGAPIPFATIQIKGTTTGTTTDQAGNFQLNIPGSNTVLIVRSLGYLNREIPAGTSTTLDVVLQTDNTNLDEVVVTALNIKRSQKSVPYAVQQVDAARLTQTRETNISSTLAGKVAGVQIQGQSGAKIGQGAVVRLRGAGSLSDKNPLFVLDGTPVSPDDINMDDVENISVLKGPNATALYGQRADAGVVVVTSKKGRLNPGIGLQLNQTTTFDKVYILPDYQNEYAGGGVSNLMRFKWQAGMPDDWKTMDGKFYHDYSDDASWGPRMVGQEYIPWYAWYPGANFGKTAKLVAQPDNVRDFYRTGISYNNNVNFMKAGEGYNVRVSFTNLQRTGVIPNSSLDKNSFSTQANFDMGRHFTVGANVYYVTENLKGEFNDGYSNNSSGSFNQWFHRDLDLGKLKELRGLKSPQGALGSWNHNNPDSYSGANPLKFYGANFWYNFFSYFDAIDNFSQRNRVFGDINLTYKLNDHFKVAAFFRRNELNVNREEKTPYILESSATQTGVKQGYFTRQDWVREDNYEGLASYNNQFFDRALSVDFNLGGNIRKNSSSFISASTVNGLTVPDLFTLSNSKDPITYSNDRFNKTVRSAYARTTLGWKDIYFLDASIRNDISSALPKNNNSYWYPSVGASIMFSEYLKKSIPFLSFGKLRAGWAQIGSDLDPYQLELIYSLEPTQFGKNSPMFTRNTLPNDGIMPSLSSSMELGTDLKFLQNRLGVSFTYYREDKRNEILTVNVSNASGFLSKVINAGSLVRNGIELQLDATPVKTLDFNWETTINFAKSKSVVKRLTDDVKTYTLPNTDRGGAAVSFGVATVVHAEGEDWGQLRGNGIKRINGQPVLNADGTFAMEQNLYFGSVLPDFMGGWFNQFTYKDITLTAALDFQKGGKYFSLSDFWGSFSGLYAKTAVLNDKGIPVRDPVADGGGVMVEGVDADGKAVKKYVEAQTYWHQFRTNSNIADMSIFDASFLKLREVSLGYNLPVKKWAPKVFTQANISLVARNVWLIYADEKGFDPSELSGRFGENGQMPGVRSFGVNLKLGF
ncbi:SusC/RagA family TonB-linked outer membrane protein [Chitinophaga caseinilytica]|uniref:SusC/RagA family TonB-linked outer membrane protein n=1 Tax=Chitinophaga caseinilytica TaxID=2267521 RepID=A0ABZ2ZCF3_9BACT